METAECETMADAQIAGDESTTEVQTTEHDLTLHGITVESDERKKKWHYLPTVL